MKRIIILLACVTTFVSSCEKENIDITDPSDFLSEESVKVNDLIGEWTWINTHGGISGSSQITPDSEGYIKSIIFSNQKNYFEILDNKLSIQTYYNIDSTSLDHYGTPIYTINYFENSPESQDMLIQQENDTLYLYLYERDDCRDCLSTSVFKRVK
jgi:hypothetical protein